MYVFVVVVTASIGQLINDNTTAIILILIKLG